MKSSIIKPRRYNTKQKSSSMSYSSTQKQVRMMDPLPQTQGRELRLKKRLTEIMFLQNPLFKGSFQKKSAGMSDFLKKVTNAKRRRHQSLQNKNLKSRKSNIDRKAPGRDSKGRRAKGKHGRTKSTFFNVFSFPNKNDQNNFKKPKNENLERLFKRYKVSKRDKKYLIYNSNQVDKNIDSLIQYVDNKFHKADEFIKKNILKSIPLKNTAIKQNQHTIVYPL